MAFAVSKTDVPETDGAETDVPETDGRRRGRKTETNVPETEGVLLLFFLTLWKTLLDVTV